MRRSRRSRAPAAGQVLLGAALLSFAAPPLPRELDVVERALLPSIRLDEAAERAAGHLRTPDVEGAAAGTPRSSITLYNVLERVFHRISSSSCYVSLRVRHSGFD